MKKRALSIVLSICMMMVMLPMTSLSTSAAPVGTETEDNGKMKWSTAGSNYDLWGYYNGSLKQTSYSNNGYSTVLIVNGSSKSVSNLRNSVEQVVSGIGIKLVPSFVNNGNYVKIEYVLRNTFSTAATVSLGSNADIQIGSNDKSPITVFDDGTGCSMKESTATDTAQFNFVGKNAYGVVNVDTFWFGLYNERTANQFNNYTSTSYNGDSGIAFSWKNRVLAAGETQSFSVIFGVGPANKNPVITGFSTSDAEGTFTDGKTLQNGQAVTVSGVASDPDGWISGAELYYSIDGGTATKLKTFDTASGNFSNSLTLPNNLRPGTHQLNVFVMDNGGATSTFATRTFVIPKIATTLDLSATPSGQSRPNSVQLSFSGLPSDATGTVTFYQGSTQIGSAVTIGSGTQTVSFAASGAINDYTFTAKYNGDSNYLNSTSSAQAYTFITGTQPSVGLANVPASCTYGQSAFTVSANGGAGTGSYVYSVSDERIASISSSGVVTIHQAGSFTISVYRTGDNDYNQSAVYTTSPIVVNPKTIQPANIGITGVETSYLFTDSAITPEPTVTVGGVTLTKDTDYEVRYADNTAIGTAAKVIVTLKGNYSGSAEKTFEIRYGAMNDTDLKNTITLPEYNSNGWRNQDITLTAKGDWTLCTTPTGTFGGELVISDESAKTGTDYIFYIKAGTGAVYKHTLKYKLDKQNPTGLEIQYNTNGFRSFLNTITFGVFFKETVDVTARATDSLSEIATYQYYAADAQVTDFDAVSWANSLRILPTIKKIIYVKATDKAGNYIIAKEGVVVYADSTPSTADIRFTKTAKADATTTVDLKGNTIKSIQNGTYVLINGQDYTTSNGTISFKASYLDTLAVGDYTLTVSYNPLGESYVDGMGNQAPLTTAISLAVERKNLSGEDGSTAGNVTITPAQYTYDGKAFAPAVTVKDGETLLNEGTNYALEWTADMVNVGEKTLTVTFKGIYAGTVTKKAEIINATINNTTIVNQFAIYNGGEQMIAAGASGTQCNGQQATVLYSVDNGATYTANMPPKFTAADTYTVYYKLSASSHNDKTGTISFTINKATDNAVKTVALTGWAFGDTANTPTATVMYGTPVFTYSDSENGVYSDVVPTQKGTYWVKATVAETADYNGCEATASFEIHPKTVQPADISITGVEASYLFTGSAITPEPTVTVGGVTLTKDIDYEVRYADNTAIGTDKAKVIVTLKGNYSGSTEQGFEIRYGTLSEDEIKNVITLPAFNSNGWYNQDIVIAAIGDWTLCATPTGTFGTSLAISEESTKTGTEYTFYIKNKDGYVYEKAVTYKLDKVAPEGSIAIEKSGLKNFLRAITFGLLFNDDVDVTVTSSDALSEIAKVEVYKADKELTEEELSNVQWSAYTVAVHETAKDAEQFIYYARITDNAGNTVIVSSEGAAFDTTAPVISGITDGGMYYTSQKVTVSDASLDIVVVNDKDFTSGNTILGNANATYKIVATDKAGNVTTYTVTMKPVADISDPLDTLTEENVKPEDQEKIEDVKKKAEAIDTTNATAEEKKAVQDIIDECDRLLKKIEADKNNEQAPPTGDTSNRLLWIALLFVSGGALVTFSVSKKCKKAQ